MDTTEEEEVEEKEEQVLQYQTFSFLLSQLLVDNQPQWTAVDTGRWSWRHDGLHSATHAG